MTMNEERKESLWVKNRVWVWILPLAVVIGLILYASGPGGPSPGKQRKIVTYSIQTAKGKILVTERRTGTEFSRIYQLPGGQVITEGGTINGKGEEQIKRLDTSER